MTISVNRQSIVDYLLVFLFFCVSGNPAFVGNPLIGKYVFFAMLVTILAFSYDKKYPKSILGDVIFWIVLSIIIFTVQFFSLGSISILASINFMIKLISAIMLAYYLDTRFPLVALKVMTVICIISLFFFGLNLLGIRFPALVPISTQGNSMIIYTQLIYESGGLEIIRNCGMFWEPGAFAGYIIATILLSINNLRYLWRKYRMNCIILLFALLSTTSTTGYISLSVLVIFSIFLFSTNKRKALFVIIPLIAVIVIAFLNIDFLWEKIKDQLLLSVETNGLGEDVSRTGSLLVDAQYIAAKPLFGNGLSLGTRYRFHSDFSEQSLAAFSNGFSGILASMGLVFFLVYVISIATNKSLAQKGLLILMIIILLQGEYFMNYPFFFVFPFVNYGGESLSKGFLKKVRLVRMRPKNNLVQE